MTFIRVLSGTLLLGIGLAQADPQPFSGRPCADTQGEKEIRASRIAHYAPGALPAKPAFAADPLNLFVVVEAGDHQVTILDGDRLEPIHRFASRPALQGEPKFSPDGRYAFFASRDGWITKYDLWNLATVAEVRAGTDTRSIALSADGRYLAVANHCPRTLVVLDADLRPVKILEARARAAKRSSRVAAVYDAAPRRSFVAVLEDARELWEISYDPKATEIAEGLVHDYKLREGDFIPGFLNPRRTLLEEDLVDFSFAPGSSQLIGAAREGGKGQVVHLDVRRRIATLELPGMPHFGSAITWQRAGRTLMAVPNLREGVLSVVDLREWKTVKALQTLGPGSFLRSHEASRHAFVDAMMSREHRDTLQVLDKETLEMVAVLRPEPGKTLAHVEFDRHGRYALASLRELDGALVVYDPSTLREVKRLPMRGPVGKYNVFNEITRSGGTRH